MLHWPEATTPRNPPRDSRQLGKAGEMPKIEVTSDAPAIAADRGYLPNVTDIMWSAAADLAGPLASATRGGCGSPPCAARARSPSGRSCSGGAGAPGPRAGAGAEVPARGHAGPAVPSVTIMMAVAPPALPAPPSRCPLRPRRARAACPRIPRPPPLPGHGRRHDRGRGNLRQLARSRTAHFPRHRVVEPGQPLSRELEAGAGGRARVLGRPLQRHAGAPASRSPDRARGRSAPPAPRAAAWPGCARSAGAGSRR